MYIKGASEFIFESCS
jgi:magnesium-transporting ATPase (P-type)